MDANHNIAEIAAALAELSPSARDENFITLAHVLARHGVAADTRSIGEAFDSGAVKRALLARGRRLALRAGL